MARKRTERYMLNLILKDNKIVEINTEFATIAAAKKFADKVMSEDLSKYVGMEVFLISEV